MSGTVSAMQLTLGAHVQRGLQQSSRVYVCVSVCYPYLYLQCGVTMHVFRCKGQCYIFMLGCLCYSGVVYKKTDNYAQIINYLT